MRCVNFLPSLLLLLLLLLLFFFGGGGSGGEALPHFVLVSWWDSGRC